MEGRYVPPGMGIEKHIANGSMHQEQIDLPGQTERPKTFKGHSSANPIIIPSAEEKKQGRGRPPKCTGKLQHLASPVIPPGIPSGKELTKKRGVGRPRKNTTASRGMLPGEDHVKRKSQRQSPGNRSDVSLVAPPGIPLQEGLAKKQVRRRGKKKVVASPAYALNNAPGEHTMTGEKVDITHTQVGSSNADMTPECEELYGTPECEELYGKIASTYGRIDENVPKILGDTFLVFRDELLKMIRDMKETPQLELTDELVTKWEEIHRIAIACNFSVGWMFTTLAKMRDFVSRQEKARILEALMLETESNWKQLIQQRKAVKELENAEADNVARVAKAIEEQKAQGPPPTDYQFFDI